MGLSCQTVLWETDRFLLGCVLPRVKLLGCHSEPPAGPEHPGTLVPAWQSSCLLVYLFPPIITRGRDSVDMPHLVYSEPRKS